MSPWSGGWGGAQSVAGPAERGDPGLLGEGRGVLAVGGVAVRAEHERAPAGGDVLFDQAGEDVVDAAHTEGHQGGDDIGGGVDGQVDLGVGGQGAEQADDLGDDGADDGLDLGRQRLSLRLVRHETLPV